MIILITRMITKETKKNILVFRMVFWKTKMIILKKSIILVSRTCLTFRLAELKRKLGHAELPKNSGELSKRNCKAATRTIRRRSIIRKFIENTI